MLAKKCDRCGKLYEHYARDLKKGISFNGAATVAIDGNDGWQCNKVMDLCPECRESFARWLDGYDRGQ